MTYTKSEFLDFIMENDVKFVKLTFCDLIGRPRNVSVLSSQLADAFEKGVTVDSVAMTGVGGVDLKLKPVSSLMSILPWRPHSGRVVSVFCNVNNADGTPYACDSMVLLDNEVKKLGALGYKAQVGTECEFYVFKEELDNGLVPFDNAGYCSCAPYDKCENLRREVITSLEDMGLKPISSHHERGRGQNEIDFENADPASAARNLMMFTSAVRNVCALNGTRASFMPRPLGGEPGSGLHLSISLSGNGRDKAADAFAEGVMRRYKEISCFANPTENSYRRLRRDYKIAYSSKRGSALRIFDDKTLLLRTPDSTSNVFTVLALVFAAGREGIENGYKLRKEGAYNDVMFNSIDEALDFADKSEWLRAQIPVVFDDVLGSLKKRAETEKTLDTDLARFEFHSDI